MGEDGALAPTEVLSVMLPLPGSQQRDGGGTGHTVTHDKMLLNLRISEVLLHGGTEEGGCEFDVAGMRKVSQKQG